MEGKLPNVKLKDRICTTVIEQKNLSDRHSQMRSKCGMEMDWTYHPNERQ